MRSQALRLTGVVLSVVISLLVSGVASATSFIVPRDEEMVDKSQAIVLGTIEGSFVQQTELTIETVYEVRIQRALKGGARAGELMRIVSPGGVIGDRGVLVPAAAHFDQGEHVLLFLTNEGGRWQTTDLTLGKFRFTVSTRGDRLLVRDMEDVVGWDRAGRVHHEVVRREEGFLRFIEQRVRGRAAAHGYEVEVSAVTLAPADEGLAVTTNATYPARTYTDFVSNSPTRWANMTGGVPFYKRSDQDIAGASDGGVSVIQGGLAAWNNECGSAINLVYAGELAKASANYDGTNIVEFNDPQSRISGSWTGAGTIAITFLSFTSYHTFLNEQWLSISDADVVFQNGYTATHAAFPTAMTHELGHGIGWRHSNQDYATRGTCDPSVEECTTAAIMNSTVSANYGYSLQPWDVHAAQAVYPGGTCAPTCTPPSITAQPQSVSITSGGSATLTVTASGTTPLSYQWYTGTSGNTASPVSGATGASVRVTPTSTTSYWVRVSNSCGSVNSATVTVTVTAPTPPPGNRVKSDFNGDGKSDLVLQNTSTAGITVWLMNGGSPAAGAQIAAPAGWSPVAAADIDADGHADVIVRNGSTGAYRAYLMATSGLSARTFVSLPSPGTSWQIVTSNDFNLDGSEDLVLQNTAGDVSIWLTRGGVVSSGIAVNRPGSAWKVVGSGDFDGDGSFDLLLQNSSTSQVTIWRMQNGRILTGAAINTPGSAWRVIAAGDVNGDNRDDVILQNSSTSQVVVWLMSGFSISADRSLGTPGTAWVVKGRADTDGDGTDDIILQNSSTKGVVVWRMVGGSVASGTQTVPPATYVLMMNR